MLTIETMTREDDGFTIISASTPKAQGTKFFEGASKSRAKKKLAKWIWDNLPGVALHKVLSKI